MVHRGHFRYLGTSFWEQGRSEPKHVGPRPFSECKIRHQQQSVNIGEVTQFISSLWLVQFITLASFFRRLGIVLTKLKVLGFPNFINDETGTLGRVLEDRTMSNTLRFCLFLADIKNENMSWKSSTIREENNLLFLSSSEKCQISPMNYQLQWEIFLMHLEQAWKAPRKCLKTHLEQAWKST